MGAWGNGSFDNDDAADWLLELIEGEDLGPALEIFARVLEADDYLEAPDASQAIAAAEVVAAALGRPTSAAQQEEGLAEWMARVRPAVDSNLPLQATKALERILAPASELRELWEESDEFSDWQSELVRLRARLKT